jgi:hypothetical protein
MHEIDKLELIADSPEYDDDKPNEGYFSWYSCDYCNEQLGGQRYDIVAFNRDFSQEDYFELSVCSHCYYNLNG